MSVEARTPDLSGTPVAFRTAARMMTQNWNTGAMTFVLPDGRTALPGTGANRQRRSQIARMASASAMAKRAPTQVRGPAPNGRYWKRCLSLPRAKRSGSKASGSFHRALWRWMIHGQIDTRSPAFTS